MKKYLKIVIPVLFLCFMNPITARADMGPKPSIDVVFQNIGDQTIYASFFDFEGGMPLVHGGDWERVPEDIQQVFSEYANGEETRFVEDVWIINKENPVMDCYYMPPDVFKLVVYVPDQDCILESDFYTKVQFEQEYSVDISTVNSDGKLVLDEKPYHWPKVIAKAVWRLLITLVIEMGLAFCFHIRSKKSLLVILCTNIATQLLLDAVIINEDYARGGFGFPSFILLLYLELLVLLFEAAVYAMTLRKTNDPPISDWKAIAYAVAANFLTCSVGLFLQ